MPHAVPNGSPQGHLSHSPSRQHFEEGLAEGDWKRSVREETIVIVFISLGMLVALPLPAAGHDLEALPELPPACVLLPDDEVSHQGAGVPLPCTAREVDSGSEGVVREDGELVCCEQRRHICPHVGSTALLILHLRNGVLVQVDANISRRQSPVGDEGVSLGQLLCSFGGSIGIGTVELPDSHLLSCAAVENQEVVMSRVLDGHQDQLWPSSWKPSCISNIPPVVQTKSSPEHS